MNIIHINIEGETFPCIVIKGYSSDFYSTDVFICYGNNAIYSVQSCKNRQIGKPTLLVDYALIPEYDDILEGYAGSNRTLFSDEIDTEYSQYRREMQERLFK